MVGGKINIGAIDQLEQAGIDRPRTVIAPGSRRFVGEAFRNKGKCQRRPDIRFAGDRHDLAGNSALERLGRIEIGLQETPLRLAVIR